MGILHLVSTPIGNLEDITLRAVKVLFSVETIYCEDTRETRKLLENITPPEQGSSIPKLISYNDFNRDKRIPEILNLLINGKNLALVSDRGTPLISDPGFRLVRSVLEYNSRVGEGSEKIGLDSIPGANSILPALQLSGLPPDKFYFVGFLPKKSKARQDLFNGLPKTTIIAFESPNRIRQTISDLHQSVGNIQVSICVELTKMYQQVFRGTPGELLPQLTTPIRGEITLVFNLKTP